MEGGPETSLSDIGIDCKNYATLRVLWRNNGVATNAPEVASVTISRGHYVPTSSWVSYL